MNKIIETYMKKKDIYKTADTLRLPLRTVHLALLKAGCLTIHDKIQCGSEKAKLGALAEEQFSKLVPKAIDANRYWKVNNPVFDFEYKGFFIDIKYASLLKAKKTKTWAVAIAGLQDFTCVFLESEKDRKLEGSYILLVPTQFCQQKRTTYLTEKNFYFRNFLVGADELNAVLDSYTAACKKK